MKSLQSVSELGEGCVETLIEENVDAVSHSKSTPETSFRFANLGAERTGNLFSRSVSQNVMSGTSQGTAPKVVDGNPSCKCESSTLNRLTSNLNLNLNLNSDLALVFLTQRV